MGIISTLKSVLGVGSRRGDREGPSGLSADREPEPEPDAASERAVKGVDEPPAPEPDVTEEPDGAREPDAAEEPGPDAAEEAPPDVGEPVDAIKGIGAAYAERLAGAGVHSVADLATADADALAEETDLGVGRIEGWIERARARIE